jgi:hypothetical protein
VILSTVTGRFDETPPELAAGIAGVAVWRDLDGRVSAFARADGVLHWIRVPRVGTFRLSRREDRVEVLPDPEASPAAIEEHYFRAILPLALQARGHEILHASAVRGPAGVLALAAPKESGKSTLAFALGRLGHELWADDAVVFSLEGGQVRALAVPFDLRLRRDPAAHFAESRRVRVTRGERSGGEPIALVPAPLAAIVVLERRAAASGAVELERPSSAEALAAVLEHAFCIDLDDAPRKQRMIETYLGLVAARPVYRLRYPSGLEHLPEIVRRLDALLAVER